MEVLHKVRLLARTEYKRTLVFSVTRFTLTAEEARERVKAGKNLVVDNHEVKLGRNAASVKFGVAAKTIAFAQRVRDAAARLYEAQKKRHGGDRSQASGQLTTCSKTATKIAGPKPEPNPLA